MTFAILVVSVLYLVPILLNNIQDFVEHLVCTVVEVSILVLVISVVEHMLELEDATFHFLSCHSIPWHRD